MRKTFIENLPRNKKGIDWINSIGYDVNFVYDDIIGTIKIIEYDIHKQKLLILYNSKIKSINCEGVRNAKLGNIINKYTSEFKIEIGTVIKDINRNLIILGRKYHKDKNGRNWKQYEYKCNTCGWKFGEINESNLLKGRGCSCCAGRTVVEGINDIPTTAPWMIPYFQGGYDEAKLYTKYSPKNIFPVCPECGRVKQNKIKIYSIYENHSIGCVCNDGISYPNKIIYSVIEQCQNQLDVYIREYRPTWTGGKVYDIYFELKNGSKYIIEMDGALGHGNIIHPKSNMTKQESIDIDNAKDKLAKDQCIHVVRIDSVKSDLEYIKNNILSSEIANVLDLSVVEWSKCDEFATSNLVKNVCSIYKNNNSLSTFDISNIVHISPSTVRLYLIRGTKIGWCDYDSKIAAYKNKVKIWKNNSKKVICLTTNKIFNSAVEGAKYYGLKSSSRIGECCNKKAKFSGKLSDGTMLYWMHYSDYLETSNILN